MGILDSVKNAQDAMRQYTQPSSTSTPAPAGDSVLEYDAEVNKGDISIRWLPHKLNERARQGWRLHTVLEQHGNTVMIWERWR